MKTKAPIFYLILFLPLLAYILICLSGVVSNFLVYDDAYNATVAKNLSAGYGYTTSFDSRIRFNPEVTTGPSLIIPAALFIHLFGTKYWVPAFSSSIISICLITIILIAMYYQLTKSTIISGNAKKDWTYFLLTAFIICVFWFPEARGIRFIGEYPAALFVSSGVLILFIPGINKKFVFLGGVLLGLAILTKLVALTLVLPIFLIWTVFFLSDSRKSASQQRVYSIFILLSGITLPSLIFEISKMLALGFSDYLSLKHLEIAYFNLSGSGISEMLASPSIYAYIVNNIKTNISVLTSAPEATYRLYSYLVCSVAIVGCYVYRLQKKKVISSLDRLSVTLLLSITTCISWWILFNSQGWYRTISPAIIIMSISIIISLFSLFKRRALPVMIMSLILWVFSSPLQWQNIFHFPIVPKEMVSSAEHTVDYLSNFKSDGKVLLGCGWWANRRLEYFSPEILNFKQCFTSKIDNSILVIDMDFWDWEHSEITARVVKRCNQLIFSDPPYFVYQCK
jgi:hypothetical protein